MSLVLQYEIDSDTAQRFFEYAGYRTRNMSEPFAQTRTLTQHWINMQFDSEGGQMSGGWEPLTMPYLERKMQSPNLSENILEATGALKRDAARSVRSGSDWVEVAIPTRSKDGEYSLVELHQEGRDGDNAMPARPVWETTTEYLEEVQFIYWRWLDQVRSRNARRRGSSRPSGGLRVEPSYTID